MFKDLPKGTTCWACPKCKGVCSSGTEHTCTGATNSIDKIVELTRGLADAAAGKVTDCPPALYAEIPKPKLTPIRCHNCNSIIKRRQEDRSVCPTCHSPHWRTPSLRQRIEAAIYHFKLGR